MVFSDLFFLFAFIPAFIIFYLEAFLLDKALFSPTPSGGMSFKARNITLVLFSLIFYAWGEPVYVFLMLLMVFINFIAGRVIAQSETHRKLALVGGLTSNLIILATFKYLSFFAGILNSIGLSVPDPKISLPIGISFYTFQSISYLIDVYRKDSPAQKRFVDLLLYISMFPQLIAGPIVRYGTVAKEITDRKVNRNDVAEGMFRFLVGLGKKVILANQLGEIADQFLVNGLNDLSVSGAWIGLAAYALQIFFDFSGYSDMAIGIGRCLGFHFNENFNHPYCCNSVTDFWRRWHMSLGSFFRDYVYIPLGGNRRHQWFNILVVWWLTGMWHGASWNFILWGLYYGLILVIEKYTIMRVFDKIPKFFTHIYAIIIVYISWGIFYFDDFGKLKTFFHTFFGGAATGFDFQSQAALLNNFWLWVAALLFCMPVRHWLANGMKRVLNENGATYTWLVFTAQAVVSVCILVLSVALLVGATNNAFIYTRF